MPTCKLALDADRTSRPSAIISRRKRRLLRLGTALTVLAAGQQAWAADCFEIEAAKPVAATPSTFPVFESQRWYLYCRENTGPSAGQPDCAAMAPAIKDFTGMLERSLDWYKIYDLQPLEILQRTEGLDTKYISYVSRTETNSNTFENPAYYIVKRDRIVFSATDILCSSRSSDIEDKAILARSVAHEMFHAFQKGAPFGSKFWSEPGREDYGAWMVEGMAEAVGLAFAAVVANKKPDYFRDTFYDTPLHMSDTGYDRGHFWYRAGEKLDNFPVNVLRDITIAEESDEVSPTDPGITFIDRMFRERGSSLREVYGRIIGENGNDDKYYRSEGNALPILKLEKPTTKEGLAADEQMAKPLATTAILFNLTPALLAPVKIDQPGIVVTNFTADFDREKAAPHLGLAVSGQWLDDKPFERVFLNRRGNLGLLGRATNVRKSDPNATIDEPVSFVGTARQLRVAGPSCIGVGRTAEIVVEYLDGEEGKIPSLEFQAKGRPGAFSGRNFTPKAAGPHLLQVKGYSSPSAQDWETFAAVNVRSRPCGVTVTIYEGGSLSGRMVYDASSDATRIESAEGEVGYADADGIVGRDDETGQWVRASNASAGGAAFGSALGYSLSGPGGPGAALGMVMPHRGPLTLAEAFKQMRKSVAQAMGLRPRAVPCPTSGSGCVRYDVPNPDDGGTMALIFDSDGEPLLAGDPDGDRTVFTYEDNPVVVPAARRVN